MLIVIAADRGRHGMFQIVVNIIVTYDISPSRTGNIYVPEGKLLTYEASGAKQAIRNYTLEDIDAGLALTVYGDGEQTSARYSQFRDKSYYLYILDTLDYHLHWGNYSAEIRPEPQHHCVARLGLQRDKK